MKFYTKGAALFLAMIMLMTFIAPVADAKWWEVPPGQLKKVTGIPPGQLKKIGFVDLDETIEWARLAIDRMYARGIFTGYPGNTFKPKNNVTHLEAIIMSLRVMGWEEEAKRTKINDDIKKINLSWNDAYYYVALAVEKGLIKPEELRGFNPNAPAKRYEVARYIVRALGMESEAKKHMKEKLPFKDANAIPKEAVGYVYVILDLELMKGDNNNKFKPNDPITRAEMAVMLNRLDESIEQEDENQLIGTIEDIDLEDLTITIQNSSGTKTYDLLEKTPVYVNGRYCSLDDLRVGDKIELVLDEDKCVVFIQVIEKSKQAIISAKGLVAEISRRTISLVTYITDPDEGFIGTLVENDIEGRHYELETNQGTFVLKGNIKGLEDYVGDKIVVKGELTDEDSIFMRGYIIDVEKHYELRSRDLVTFDVDSDTKITLNGNKAKLSEIDAGDFAQVRADGDNLALEIMAESFKDKIEEWKRERKNTRDGKLEGKVVSVSFETNWQLTIKNDDGQYTLIIDKNVELEGVKSLRHLKRGMEIELRIKNGKIIKIEVND
ncbi:MAG: hypothetical protein GX892_16535 [Thermoanaerobacteraceae bacterium]|nr:hypothetical protein [Thermoanaerobacteraceae bacterium]